MFFFPPLEKSLSMIMQEKVKVFQSLRTFTDNHTHNSATAKWMHLVCESTLVKIRLLESEIFQNNCLNPRLVSAKAHFNEGLQCITLHTLYITQVVLKSKKILMILIFFFYKMKVLQFFSGNSEKKITVKYCEIAAYMY